MAATRNPTSSGEGTQSSGGMGDPNVGTGWTNLTNFLNPTNLEFGAGMIGPAQPMDPATGRSPEDASFENWMKSASGNTSQKPIDVAAPDTPKAPPSAPIWSVPTPTPVPTPTDTPKSEVDKPETIPGDRFANLNKYLAW